MGYIVYIIYILSIYYIYLEYLPPSKTSGTGPVTKVTKVWVILMVWSDHLAGGTMRSGGYDDTRSTTLEAAGIQT